MQTYTQSILNKYAVNLAETFNQHSEAPLKHHTQIPHLLDILGRKERHHILIHSTASEKFQLALLKSIAFHLSIHSTKKFNEAQFIFFDTKRFNLGHEKAEDFTQEFSSLCNDLTTKNSYIFFAINDLDFLQTKAGQLLQTKLLDNQWRLIILNQPQQVKIQHLEQFFTVIRLSEPTEKEMISILKSFQHDIEAFHQVTIPEEIFPYALSLATYYLGGKSHLDKALELLDSSAARASADENNDPSIKPILSPALVMTVASNWTHIPLTHLHHNKFKLSKFLHHIPQKIFGQDAAINTIGSLLQTACVNFKENAGPLCSLLLTGPAGVGKNEFALSLAEHLFANKEALLQVTLNKHQQISSLSDIFVTIRGDKTHRVCLLEAIQSKPYAVMLFENLHEMTPAVIDLFSDIFTHGYALDNNGNAYDFRHAIIIISTTLGAERISNIMQKHAESASPKIMDLMQLVLNENTNPLGTFQHLSQQEIREQILPELQPCFSSEILRHSHIIPFTPIDQNTLEKIIKLKLNHVAKSLEKEFGIELSYASEVVGFLATETMKLNDNAQPIKKLFEQHVHSSIANEILAKIDERNRQKRLALLLNDSGQLLRCEFINTHEPTAFS